MAKRKQTNHNAILLLILGVLLVVGVFTATHFSRFNNVQKTSYSPSIWNKPTDIPNQRYIEFAIINNEPVLKYQNSTFKAGFSKYKEPINANLNTQGYNWTNLVKLSDVDDNPVIEGVFSFVRIPNTNSYMLVARPGLKSYQVYIVNFGKDTPTVTDITSKIVKSHEQLNVPRINSISPDGKAAEFSMYYCWNCDGHKPQTLLLNLSTLKTKNIGLTYRDWETLGNGRSIVTGKQIGRAHV